MLIIYHLLGPQHKVQAASFGTTRNTTQKKYISIKFPFRARSPPYCVWYGQHLLITIKETRFMNKKGLIALTILLMASLSLWAGGVDEVTPAQGTQSARTGKFGESPMLAAMVEAGELPPVEQRIPQDPAVIEPFQEIGQYGGTLTVFAGGPDPWQDFGALGENGPKFFRILLDGTVVGDMMTDYEWADNYKQITIYMRDGIRWSDGAPATVDDVLFTYNDMHAHPDVTMWSWLGDVEPVVKLDEKTLRFNFPTPRPEALRYFASVMGNAWMGIQPMHYLKEWHIDYNPDAQKLAEDEGYEHWYELMNYHYWWNPLKDLDHPSIQPWIMKESTTTHKLFERNPYYSRVDSAGNQLPYIDRILSQIIDPEVYHLKIISGESDVAYMFTSFDNYTLYKENEASGDYSVHAIPGLLASELAVYLNHNSPDADKRELFNNKKFKQALSLAINRDEINALVFSGQGSTVQATIQPKYTWYKDEWGKSYAQYDTKEANRLLDEIGLTKRDSEGYRVGPSGNELLVVLEAAALQIGSGQNKILELLSEYWKAVGVNTMMKLLEGGLYSERSGAGLLDARNQPLEVPVQLAVSSPDAAYWAPMWHRWMDATHAIAAGTATLDDYEGNVLPGEEPPQWIKDYDSYYHKAKEYPEDSREFGEWMSKLLDIQAEELFVIGTVGLVPSIITAKNYIVNVPPMYGPHHVWSGALSEFCDQFAIKKQ
jgi:peptide/nickel transport system substrate-binding protein